MKLYELPQRKKIKLYGAKQQDTGNDIVIVYHHLDGMYSYCEVEDMEGDLLMSGDHVMTVHLSASTPIHKRDGKYYIGEENT